MSISGYKMGKQCEFVFMVLMLLLQRVVTLRMVGLFEYRKGKNIMILLQESSSRREYPMLIARFIMRILLTGLIFLLKLQNRL